MEVDLIPVPVTEVGIGALRVPIPDNHPIFADEALVASASVISDFEDSYLTELTAAVDRSLKSLRQMVVSRLRARATVAEPVAASAGRQFANPWHDELGRFAPKGTGSYRAIGAKYERIVGDFVETGTVAEPPDVEMEVIDTDTSDRYTATHPLGGKVIIHDEDGVIDDPDRAEAIAAAAMAAKIAGDFPSDLNITVQNRANKTAKGWIVLSKPDQVFMHATYAAEHGTWETAAKEKAQTPATEMASEPMIDTRSWTAMHETGHAIHGANFKVKSKSSSADDQLQAALYDSAAQDLYADHQGSPLVSEYAKKNYKEMYAETFAEWVNTNGSTNNPIIQQYAETFGWRYQDGSSPYGTGLWSDREPALAAAGPPDDDRDVMVEYTDPVTGAATGAALTEAEFDEWINGSGPPPTEFTIGQFANPWHDDLGRFAPKGTGRAHAIRTWGTDRTVTIEKWELGHKHSVTTANGDVITLHDHNNVMSQREDGDRIISDLLNGAADAHDLSPEMPPPKIMVKDVDGLIADMAALYDVDPAAWERLRNVSAFVTGTTADGGQAPGWIFVNPERIMSEELWADNEMPAMLSLGPARYKVMHEYGHLRMTNGLDRFDRINDQFQYTSGHRRNGGMSKYGNTKPIEAHAEAFAEWAARGGNIPRTASGGWANDVDYVVWSYANAFGWGNDLEQVGQEALAAAAWSPVEMPDIIGDSPEGPIYLYADGRVEETIVASAAVVAAGPFDLLDFNLMTAEEWAAVFGVEAADIVGDVVVDAATGQALRPGLNVTDKVITDLIDRHVGRLTDLGPLVQTSIRDALTLAVREQLSLEDVIREIQATGPLGETAARSIARTELTAATNGGMLTGWKRDGFPFKQWISLHDDRVRHAHLEADKQVVPTEQEFEVGGWPAQYPGDPRLPIHLRINCRCYMNRVGENGQTINTRLVDSTRAQLYRLAQELNIPGRSKMNKDALFQAIDRYRNGFGYTSLEEMNRAQLLIRARAAGIVGRWRMTKPELMVRLRYLAAGRDRDRWLIDAGHGTREELAAVQTQLAADIAALTQPSIVAAGPPPNAEKIDTIRRKVFNRYNAAETGTTMCVGCGARLHWSNSTRWEQMTLLRIDQRHAWSSKNAYPVCLADAAKLASLASEKLSATFTIDQFVNPWHDEVGRFAPKGTGTKFDSAKIKQRVDEAFAAQATYQGINGHDAPAVYEKFGQWAKEMGREFANSDGAVYTSGAIDDIAQGSKGFIGTSPKGVTGAISYEFDKEAGEYMIHTLGSTGIAPGVGSQLVAQVMTQAAGNNAGVRLVAAATESAPNFWTSMGFKLPSRGAGMTTMSPDDVAAWVRDLKAA